MTKVYFKPYEGKDNSELSAIAKELISVLVEQENVTLEKEIPIKVHFGEKGNKTFVPAACYNGIIDYLKENQVETSFIETNVLYRGARTTKENHIATAKSHGFTQIPIIIADGEMGEAIYEVPIHKEYFETVKLGKAFENYDQVVVMSHFKGHGLAGFGGAIKQLSMGFASRSGKMAQHSKMVPNIKGSKCVACGVCVDKCDVNAITIDGVAEIDEKLCIGCAGCIAVCPVAAIANDWGADNFREKVAEYAYGAQLNKRHLYVSFMINITEDCDCIGKHMDPIARNFGVLASTDPVALDTACLEILQQNVNEKLFDSGRTTLNHAVKIGFGSTEYEVVTID